MREHIKQNVIRQSSGGYFIGFIGAAIYFIQHATGFWPEVVGFLKACIWPAFAVYHLFDFLKV